MQEKWGCRTGFGNNKNNYRMSYHLRGFDDPNESGRRRCDISYLLDEIDPILSFARKYLCQRNIPIILSASLKNTANVYFSNNFTQNYHADPVNGIEDNFQYENKISSVLLNEDPAQILCAIGVHFSRGVGVGATKEMVRQWIENKQLHCLLNK